MAVSLHYGRRMLGQTLRATGRKTASTDGKFILHSLAAPALSNKLTGQSSQIDASQSRSFNRTPSNHGAPKDLMDYPRIVPNVLQAALAFLRNTFFERYIIHRHDAEFTMEEFKRGATAALIAVSNILASDDVTPLLEEGLVDPVAFSEIKANHGRMNASRRRTFRIEEKNVRHAHIHQIGILEDDDTSHKAVEIMMVFAVIDVEKLKDKTPQQITEGVFMCNYRFYRDYTDKNNPSPWILNVVNQFRLGQMQIDE